MNSWNHPAPSILADSNSARVDPAHAREQQDGAEPEQDPDPDEADGRQGRSRSRPARPRDIAQTDRGQGLVDQAVRDSSRPQMMPAATSGMTCGRNRTVRETVPSLPGRDAVDDAGGHEAEGDRDEAEEHDEPERVEERLDELRVAEDGRRSSTGRPRSTGRHRPSGTASTERSGPVVGARRRRT